MKHKGENHKRLISQKEAADYLGISYWTLRDLVFQGELAHIKIGRRVLLDLEDLEDYIQKAKVQHFSQDPI